MSGPSPRSEPSSLGGLPPSGEPSPTEGATPFEGGRFLVDRMLGPLVRYLRFMGYDTLAATELGPGGPGEDSALLRLAAAEGRVLLTRDRELAGRGGVLVEGDDVLEQVDWLTRAGFVEPVLRLDRCSRCNTLLRRARAEEITAATYLPVDGTPREFFRCDSCGRLYWAGSHADRLAERLAGASCRLESRRSGQSR